jgi:glucose-1-phosphate thymidylyltransferase
MRADEARAAGDQYVHEAILAENNRPLGLKTKTDKLWSMKGVLICGGTGSRLKPLTDITNKSLLPIYDRPLIHAPLGVLTNAGITEIAVITGPEHMDQIAQYLGSGERFGCKFAFTLQEKPSGIAHALGLAEDFAHGDSICAILGDNVFFDDLTPAITAFKAGAHLFIKEVKDPERFGVVTLDGDRVASIEEKPKAPKSSTIATGCYLYDARCFDVIRSLEPSKRGELEITDVSAWYLAHGELTATILQEEWVDAGTFESLHRAAELVREKLA